MFENMTFEEWSQSTDPKIQGTLNLHQLFSEPEGLAFFVTLSSVSSIVGNMGQSNYCAGNGFMDALMEWRRNHGLAGCSINVGLVPDASGVSDIIKDQEERLRRYNHLGGTEILTHELQTLLRVIINSKLSLPHQIIAGMTDTLSRKNAPTAWLLDRKFDHRISLAPESSDSSAVSTATLLKEAESVETAAQIVLDALSEYLATAMATTADSIDADLPLSALGGTFILCSFLTSVHQFVLIVLTIVLQWIHSKPPTFRTGFRATWAQSCPRSNFLVRNQPRLLPRKLLLPVPSSRYLAEGPTVYDKLGDRELASTRTTSGMGYIEVNCNWWGFVSLL